MDCENIYSSNWEAFYGSSSLNISTGEVEVLNYGPGTVCGGNIMKINDQIYRTANGGVMPLNRFEFKSVIAYRILSKCILCEC